MRVVWLSVILTLYGLIMGCAAAPEAVSEKTGATTKDGTTKADRNQEDMGPPVTDLRTRISGSDWPRFLGPTRDGKSTETGITPWPAAGPPILWWRQIGEGYSMPSISQGRLFLFDRVGDQARLTCLQSETGEELWRQEYPVVYEDLYGYSGGPRASPVIDGERVYTFGVEGRLRSHHVVDGRLLWDVDTHERFGVVQNFFGAGSTPVIEGDVLIVPVGGSPQGSPGIMSGEVQGNGSGLVGFDKWTGEVRFQTSDTLASYASPVISAIGKQRFGFHLARGGLIVFDPEQGEVLSNFPWRAKMLESVNASTPVVVENTVLITETYGPGGALLKVLENGELEVLWKDGRRDQSLACHWSTPIHHQGYLYASTGRSSGNAELRCIEHRTGKVLWSEPGLRRSSLLYVDDHFVVLGEYGELWLIKADPTRFHKVSEVVLEVPDQDREGRSRTEILRHPAWNAPILAHGLLYVRGKDTLVCLDLIPAS